MKATLLICVVLLTSCVQGHVVAEQRRAAWEKAEADKENKEEAERKVKAEEYQKAQKEGAENTAREMKEASESAAKSDKEEEQAEKEKEAARTPKALKEQICQYYTQYIGMYEKKIAKEKELGSKYGQVNQQAIGEYISSIASMETNVIEPVIKEYEQKSNKKFSRSDCKK